MSPLDSEWLSAEAELLSAHQRITMRLCMDLVSLVVRTKQEQRKQEALSDWQEAQFKHLAGKA